jgi:hypothetical protein
MAATHGKEAVVKYGGTDITAYVNKSGLAQTADKSETSTFGKNSKTYIPGLADGTIPLEGPFDPAVHAILAPLFNSENAFEFDPAGTTAGLPKATCQAILDSYDVSSDTSGVSTIKGSLQITGDVTWTTN